MLYKRIATQTFIGKLVVLETTYPVALHLCNYSVAMRSMACDSLRVCCRVTDLCVTDCDVRGLQILTFIRRMFEFLIVVAKSM
jgi:hypothetical protein